MSKGKARTISAADAARAVGASDHLLRIIEAGGALAPRSLAERTLRDAGQPWKTRRGHGESLRACAPLEAHGAWIPAPGRPNPLDIIAATNVGREEELVPLRMARMAESPFAFLRGAAAVMAWDLAHGPSTGLNVVIDGDAHFNNFGLFGTAQRDVVLDLNDFDEVTVGPWEWDLKRLTASVNVAARENGLNRRERRTAVMECVSGYRWNIERLRNMPVLELWYEHILTNRLDGRAARLDAKSAAVFRKAVDKARVTDNAALLGKIAERGVDGRWRFKEEPPILTRIGADVRDAVIDGLEIYVDTLAPERQYMLRRYHVVDVAHRIVGVGSVGTRAFVALLMGNGDLDPLFLQVKEATVPAHAPYLPPLPDAYRHEGRRVVFGQRLLQAAGDPLLGWTDVGGRPFYVRQMKNLKASIATDWLSGEPFNFFSWAYGSLLARAHARSGDGAVISGYCGREATFDEVLADWAEAYAAQTREDHAALVEAIEAGDIETRMAPGGQFGFGA
jgi:uncharacterized protein (DUF2252 family)